MHEMALTGPIVDIVVRQANICKATRVRKVNLRVGELRDVVEPMMKDCFRHFAKGTVAEEADLEIEHVSLRVRCRDCDCEFSGRKADLRDLRCPSCQGRSFELLAGSELYVRDIEID